MADEKIILSIKRPDETRELNESKIYTENLALTLFEADSILRVAQYPVIDIQGAHIIFDIPLSQSRIQINHESEPQDQWLVEIQIENAIKPCVVSGNGNPGEKDVQTANARV